jgi:flagellar hook-basal body complex protein FliE
VEKGDWAAARNTAAEALRVWMRLKPTLNATAQKSAASFESTVNALIADVGRKDSAATTADANALLDKVDVLEQAYTG